MYIRGNLYGFNLKYIIKYRDRNIIIFIYDFKSNKYIENEYLIKIRFLC